jgi:hypothetical protein
VELAGKPWGEPKQNGERQFLVVEKNMLAFTIFLLLFASLRGIMS